AGGNAYVTGTTSSTDFPATGSTQACSNSAGDAFVTKLSPASAVVYSTCVGGGGQDQGLAVTVDAGGAAYVVGVTNSSNFPTTSSSLRPMLGGGTDAFAVRIGSAADLSVAIDASRETVMIGNDLVYTITVTNSGPSTTVATLTDTLPAGVTFVSAAATQGVCTGTSNVSCSLGEMTAQSTATLTLTVRPTSAGALSNTVSVAGGEFDPNTANNTATRAVNVSSHPSIIGKVSDAGGSAFSGVTVSLGGAQSASATTDTKGIYQFTELTDGGNYVVTPSKAGFTFTPLSRNFTDLKQDATADFAAAPCSYSISPPTQDFTAAGGAGSVTVTANGDCPWTAKSGADWITITSGASGHGSGTVSFSVAPTNAPRGGYITVAGQTFGVWQEFNSCDAPSFVQARAYTLPNRPLGIGLVAADFNHDGKLDLATLVENPRKIAVLFGNGAGGFGAPSYFTPGLDDSALTSGDINGDGNVDLISTDLFAVHFLFGDGAGGFSAPTKISLSNRFHYSTTAADFNGDGKLDLAVSYQNNDSTSNVVSVVLGDGAGHFGAPLNVFTGQAAAVADFNSDGKLDLAILTGFNNVSVRLGDGTGNFGAAINTPSTIAQTNLVAKDVNGDGKLDLIAATGTQLGDGVGGFGAVIPTPGNFQSTSVAVEDFNNDGKPDLAVATSGVSILPGDGTGHFGAAIEFPARSQGYSTVIGDFNGDGRPDLATANYNSGSVVVMLNGCHAAAGVSITGRVANEDGGGMSGFFVKLTSQKLGTITTVTDSGGNYAFRDLSRDDDYSITAELSPYTFPIQTVNHPNADTVVNFTATLGGVRFVPGSYEVGEGDDHVTLTVVRSGDTTSAATVSYTTIDDQAAVSCNDTAHNFGAAYARCDYATTVDTLTFAPGETSKTITVPIIDDAHVEGDETFRVLLFNAQGVTQGTPIIAGVTIRDNDTGSSPNPIFNTTFFVRMQYLDFLSRDPEPGEPWSATLDNCAPNDTRCDRISVSSSFFRSPEFQFKGLFVFHFYKVAFGRLPTYTEVVADMRRVTDPTTSGVQAKKAAFTNAFVQRPEFKNLYDSLSNV
ncbi:MAG: large repetitive protein, partial [Acidobacteriota bacterium]|nr:large repetitive protein [Acidobacteriota bacterium]